MLSDKERADRYERWCRGLYEIGREALGDMALEGSAPLPPMPEWDDLPRQAKMAFAIEANDLLLRVSGLTQSVVKANALIEGIIQRLDQE